MPSEKRLIIFESGELIAALSEADRVAADSFLAGDITSIDIVDNKQLWVRTGNGGPSGELQIVPNEVLKEALIRFCLENDIVLDRNATKAIRFMDRSVALLQELDGAMEIDLL